jgi:hypothetical protein
MNLFVWFLLLITQTIAFTWLARVCERGSLTYHVVAATASNGLWFVANLFLIAQVTRPGLTAMELTELGVIYVLGTTLGSVLMHEARKQNCRRKQKGK